MWSRLSLFWKCQLAGWVTFIILSFPLKLVVFGSIYSAFFVSASRDGLVLLLTAAMREIYRSIYHEQMKIIWMIAVSLMVSGMMGLLLTGFSLVLYHLFGLKEQTAFFGKIGFEVFYFHAGLCVCWSFLYFGIKSMRERAEHDLRLVQAEAAKSEMELQLLRAQMNPHFLFNALNTIRGGLEKPEPELKSTVQSLADYLRYSLDHGNEDLVPLGEEYDAMLDYLKVEKSRFREDLTCDCQMDDALRSVRVPGIVLQPLVENAIKYGRETSDLPLQVGVRIAEGSAGTVQITVTNSGHWLAPENTLHTPGEKSSHLGLQNLRRRLELLYPGSHSMEIKDATGWVSVEVQIPAERQELF